MPELNPGNTMPVGSQVEYLKNPVRRQPRSAKVASKDRFKWPSQAFPPGCNLHFQLPADPGYRCYKLIVTRYWEGLKIWF